MTIIQNAPEQKLWLKQVLQVVDLAAIIIAISLLQKFMADLALLIIVVCSAIAVGLSGLAYLLAQMTKKSSHRCVKCPHKHISPMVNNVLIEFTKFALAIVYFTIVFNVMHDLKFVDPEPKIVIKIGYFNRMACIVLSIRAFTRLYSSPAACSVETAIAITTLAA